METRGSTDSCVSDDKRSQRRLLMISVVDGRDVVQLRTGADLMFLLLCLLSVAHGSLRPKGEKCAVEHYALSADPSDDASYLTIF